MPFKLGVTAMRFRELTFKRNADDEMEAWNEHGETTGVLTLGELLEQAIALYSYGTTRSYPMHTPEQWEAQARRVFRREPDDIPRKLLQGNPIE